MDTMKRSTAAAVVCAVWSFGATMALGELYNVASAKTSPDLGGIPICQVEDGSDVDGLCFWVDPDTGDLYLNPTPEEAKR